MTHLLDSGWERVTQEADSLQYNWREVDSRVISKGRAVTSGEPMGGLAPICIGILGISFSRGVWVTRRSWVNSLCASSSWSCLLGLKFQTHSDGVNAPRKSHAGLALCGAAVGVGGNGGQQAGPSLACEGPGQASEWWGALGFRGQPLVTGVAFPSMPLPPSPNSHLH